MAKRRPDFIAASCVGKRGVPRGTLVSELATVRQSRDVGGFESSVLCAQWLDYSAAA